MYFELSEFYKRDVYFAFSNDSNIIPDSDFTKGENLLIATELIYNVDKIDKYIDNYDILPTFGPPLVSEKFKNLFQSNSEIECFRAKIIDDKGNINSSFFALNVLNILPCLDREKSVIESKKYGDAIIMKIKKLCLIPNSLDRMSIVRMYEDKKYIIVTKEFKDKIETAKLKGFDFVEEGNSIYTNF